MEERKLKAYKVDDGLTYSLQINMVDKSWSYVIKYALGWILIPFLVIISKLLNKKIEF